MDVRKKNKKFAAGLCLAGLTSLVLTACGGSLTHDNIMTFEKKVSGL